MYIYERVPSIPLSLRRGRHPPPPQPREVPPTPLSLYLFYQLKQSPPLGRNTSHVEPLSNVIISLFCSCTGKLCQYPES
jgi:hypothetical protein